MKSNFVVVCIVLGVGFLFAQSWAVCPEEPVDAGECDTLYVEVHPPDVQASKDPYYFVRFPIRVTHDIVDPAVDSMAGFVIPFCYTNSNPAAYCSLTGWWNTTELNSYYVAFRRSIFRDLEGETNWIHSLYGDSFWPPPPEAFLDLDGTSHFWLSFMPTGSGNRCMPDASRALLATMTFRLDDSTTICIDSCFWPPSHRLAFANTAAQSYIPRDNLPGCQPVGVNFGPPFFMQCPSNESRAENGSGFTSGPFAVETFPSGGEIIGVSTDFVESGLDNVSVVYTVPPPAERVEGYVTYDVADHCGPSGTIWIVASDEYQRKGECSFLVELANDPPVLALPDTLLGIAGATRVFNVPATDPNNDAVGISFNALWYEPDSLQPPLNPPSYVEGNPGFFSWLPTETEQGSWICSFTATDVCGGENVGEMTILVGPLFCGDNTGNGEVTIGDVIYLLHWLYKAGPAPEPLCKGDANCDGVGDVGDVVRLLNYLFKYGPAPCFDCCAGGL